MSESKTGVQEWAETSVNCCTGCSHGCIYCYAAADYCLRYKRRPRERWIEEKVRHKDVRKRHPKYAGTVMFPTTHDITEGTVRACVRVIHQLVDAGNDVLVVSKMSPWIAQTLVDAAGSRWRDQLEFRISIGMVHESVRQFWEPKAPGVGERLGALCKLHLAGFRTSVSAEPLLQPHKAVELVTMVDQYVSETIWIGKLNQIEARCGWALQMSDWRVQGLMKQQKDGMVMGVVRALEGYSKIRWKDSYAAVIQRQAPGHGPQASGPTCEADDVPGACIPESEVSAKRKGDA